MALPKVSTLLVGWKTKLLIAGGVLLSLAIAVSAIYFIGLNKGKSESKVAIANYEKKISDQNAANAKKVQVVTDHVITTYHTHDVIHTKVVVQNQTAIKSVPTQFKLSQGWIYAHNQSAADQPIDPKLAANNKPSTVTDTQALGIINENYSISNGNNQRHQALIDWIKGAASATNQTIPNK